jgi:hypothetical protein
LNTKSPPKLKAVSKSANSATVHDAAVYAGCVDPNGVGCDVCR